MQVTLKYPHTGSATHTATIPMPLPGPTVTIVKNQKEYRSPAGNLWTVKLGPTVYVVTRIFPALSEQQGSDVAALLEACGFARDKIRYCYTDVVTGESVEVVCRIVEAPAEQIVHIRNRDLTLTFEQYTHPDAVVESSWEDLLVFGDGSYFGFEDGELLDLVS
mgnify:FL=1